MRYRRRQRHTPCYGLERVIAGEQNERLWGQTLATSSPLTGVCRGLQLRSGWAAGRPGMVYDRSDNWTQAGKRDSTRACGLCRNSRGGSFYSFLKKPPGSSQAGILPSIGARRIPAKAVWRGMHGQGRGTSSGQMAHDSEGKVVKIGRRFAASVAARSPD